MKLIDEFRQTRVRWSTLGFYQRFEQTVLYILTALIAVVVAEATLRLAITNLCICIGYDQPDRPE